ncbi:unnamed protein product [Candida parapsilosis]
MSNQNAMENSFIIYTTNALNCEYICSLRIRSRNQSSTLIPRKEKTSPNLVTKFLQVNEEADSFLLCVSRYKPVLQFLQFLKPEQWQVIVLTFL